MLLILTVEDLGIVEGQELITESADLTVEDETFEIDVGSTEAGKTWGLIASTGLETDYLNIRNVNQIGSGLGTY